MIDSNRLGLAWVLHQSRSDPDDAGGPDEGTIYTQRDSRLPKSFVVLDDVHTRAPRSLGLVQIGRVATADGRSTLTTWAGNPEHPKLGGPPLSGHRMYPAATRRARRLPCPFPVRGLTGVGRRDLEADAVGTRFAKSFRFQQRRGGSRWNPPHSFWPRP